MNPAVVVTGASGFIGTAVLARLGAGRARALSVRGPDWRACAGHVAFDGATLVHLGGRAHAAGADAAGIHADNCGKSLALAELARARGLKRMVFVSSAKVHGESSRAHAFTEQDVPAPADAYAIAKRDAETGLAGLAAATGLELVVLRPPLVYGPGVRGNLLSLLGLAASGWPLPFASLDNQRSLLGLANLAGAIEACIAHPAAAGQTFLVCDGAPVSTAQLVAAMRSAMGRAPGLFAFPGAWLRALGTLAGRRGQADRLTRSMQVDDSHLRRTLGWHPTQEFEAGVAEMAAWYAAAREASR
jgi:nucleoside-diphosphate-sugar epimerase